MAEEWISGELDECSEEYYSRFASIKIKGQLGNSQFCLVYAEDNEPWRERVALILAAPEMLTALKELVEDIPSSSYQKQILNLIARAETPWNPSDAS